ncbi:ribosomal protein L6 [Apiospora arundinis]
MAHTKAQKDKVRKSGLSLQNKTQDLGRYCDVFSALAYWNPTHERMETAMHFRQSVTCHARPSHCRTTRSRRHAEAVDFEAQPAASDDANAGVVVDSDAGTEYETDPEYVAAVPAAAGEPLSVYDVVPDEDGGTVRGLEGDGQGKHRRKVEENEIDPPLSGTSWDLIHAYEFLLETLESAKRAVANFPDGHHLAVNINLGWLKLNEYYEHLNDSPLVYGAAVLHPAYRWALFDDLWGDDDERRLWITKAKEMVQDLWEREYRDLEVDDPEVELPANKRLKTSRNKFTAWRTKKRGLTAGGISASTMILKK